MALMVMDLMGFTYDTEKYSKVDGLIEVDGKSIELDVIVDVDEPRDEMP